MTGLLRTASLAMALIGALAPILTLRQTEHGTGSAFRS